jgi:hypothetical protein
MNKQLSMLLCGAALSLTHLAQAQTTAFTYQGKLNDGNNATTGLYDITFSLFDSLTLGSQVGSTLTGTAMPVTNGVFTTSLDFGSAPFNGASRWLQIAVRTNGTGSFTVLDPRTAISPTPYAIYAQTTASVANGVIGNSQLAVNSVASANLQASSVTSAKIASGQVVKSLNGLADNVTLTAGANITLTPSGNNISINSSGSGAFSLSGNNAYYNAGKVGIGTTTPSGTLSLLNSSSDLIFKLEDQRTSNTQWDFLSKQAFYDWHGEAAYVGLRHNMWNGPQPRALVFGISSETGTPATEKMRIAYNGNVGIGTTDPNGKLEILSPTAGSEFLRLAYGPNDYHSIRSYINGNPGRSALMFDVEYATRDIRTIMTLKGNAVGIGTTDPSARLHIATTADEPVLKLSQGNPNAWCGLHMSNAAGNSWSMNVHDGAEPALAFWAGQNFAFGCDWNGNFSVKTLTINGADLAEPFEISTKDIPKGSVVVIDEEHPGQLKQSTRAYDKTVAGILSGANGVRPGIKLEQQGFNDGGQEVALCGRVYAFADASNGPIEPGDMLTTSDTPGHCMKVTDHAKAQGAIIGKAMSSLTEGKGYVLVLVSLQ